MKTLKSNKLILCVIAFFVIMSFAYAYPPDNAAVLYYKAAAVYEVDDEMAETLNKVRKGEAEINDTVREFVNKNRRIIDTVLDAAKVKNCDWGMDFSQGLKMDAPPLYSLKKMTFLVIADAKILASDGDYEAALSRCMSLYRMARHMNDRIYVSYLVGIAIQGLTNGFVTQIMADMPQDIQHLTNLKNQLIEIDSIPLSVMPAVLGEREAMLMFMTKEHIPDVVQLCVEDELIKEKLLSADESSLARSRQLSEKYYTSVIAALGMPYTEGYTSLKNLGQKLEDEAKSDPDKLLVAILAPATNKIFSLATRIETHNNAIKTAIEIYLIKAKTGKLPDTLSAGLPGDLFSGKDFEYQVTDEGFILRCQGKDLSRDEVYEYEFGVKK